MRIIRDYVTVLGVALWSTAFVGVTLTENVDAQQHQSPASATGANDYPMAGAARPVPPHMAAAVAMQNRIANLATRVYDRYTGNSGAVRATLVKEITAVLEPLRAGGEIRSFSVKSDDTNNDAKAVDSGHAVVQILWTPITGDSSVQNRIFIGTTEQAPANVNKP